ncbi:uncharacterized protein [Primulina huaijiensis]|uniref:uncharacterized protein n=1 Tax=Primulina huaijiensis TaxID=1492673 RepID=UPI003CC75DDD
MEQRPGRSRVEGTERGGRKRGVSEREDDKATGRGQLSSHVLLNRNRVKVMERFGEHRREEWGQDVPREPVDPRRRMIEDNPPRRGMIHMILRGATDGDSGRAWNVHGRRLENFEISRGADLPQDLVISFEPKDLRGVMAPHNNALVVTSTIANYDMARIFIDNGSFVNMLFNSTLDQMKVEGFEFESVSTPCMELTGTTPDVAEHRLNILPNARPVKQKKRHFGPENDKVIKKEVGELLSAGHIQEVQFPTWLSNVVLVPKSLGKWRMCVDFRDLNKGYHQIPLAMKDQDKVCFITSEGTFCYVVMPFGLKNAEATYQGLMDKVFSEQVGRNVEVYVNDIMVKLRDSTQLIPDLVETFSTLRSYGLMLNPQKCIFGVRSGKFLGYMVTEKGIVANSKKSLPNRQRVSLCGYIYLPPKELSVRFLSSKRDKLNSMSTMFHMALKGAEIRYSGLKKLTLALVMMARCLRPYSLSHPIVVLTNSSLGRILTHSDMFGRLVRWTTELGGYDMQYEPRTAIKIKALDDFLAETVHHKDEALGRCTWTIPLQRMEVGWVGTDLPTGVEVKLAVRLDFQVSNNEAEYEAVLACLRTVRNVGAIRVLFFSDSQLVSQQMKGVYKVKNEKLIEYAREVDMVREKFTEVMFEQISRKENEKANTLAKIAGTMGSWKTRNVVFQVEFTPHEFTCSRTGRRGFENCHNWLFEGGKAF